MSAILVIDDEKGFLYVIHQLLTGLGYDVETAADGTEGIRKFDSRSFEIVITDIRMPGADGIDVLKHIRKSDKRSVPVIAISGTPWLAGTSDFDKVLTKPFPLAQLVESIQTLLPLQSSAAVGT